MAQYYLNSTYSLWSLVKLVHYLGNRVSFGTHSMTKAVQCSLAWRGTAYSKQLTMQELGENRGERYLFRLGELMKTLSWLFQRGPFGEPKQDLVRGPPD
jgi:hypothetical protein